MKHMQQSAFLYMLFLVILGLSASRCTNSEILPLDEGYKPDHKIDFSHVKHEKIDCKLCHDPKVTTEKKVELLCAKCHKEEKGKSAE